MPITFNEEPLPPDDPLYTGGIKIVYGAVEPYVTPAEDEGVEFDSPSVPGRRIRMNRPVEESE